MLARVGLPVTLVPMCDPSESLRRRAEISAGILSLAKGEGKYQLSTV